ncbi:MAG: nuclear transport factor 2 family protein [Anaerolineae bacterium]|nr:nuclear transport factor 2 family protein [Anaerolineae bacterium]
MNSEEQEIWDFLHHHLRAIFNRDAAAYQATTAPDLSLYEWFVTPHRMDGLDFHLFMIKNSWAGTGTEFRYDLFEPRLQRYGDTAIVSYTFMLSIAGEQGIRHQSHNESRVLVKGPNGWQVVHVHKSPAGQGE